MSKNAQTIIVTGANGYLACHIIDQLLRKGYSVRGTVRSESAENKLRDTFPVHFGSRLTTLYVRDLTQPENLERAFDANTIGVIHAASPVHGNVQDNMRDMLDPAIKGATSVLEACKLYASTSLRRVIIMSSLAAHLDISKGARPGYTYTESDWNPITLQQAATINDHVALYVASKALSERAVWAWVTEHKPNFDVTCLNPSMVLGPHLEHISSPDEVRSTAKLMWQLVDSKEIPSLEFAGCVDVRDAAAMLVAALEVPAAACQRLLLAHHFDWQTAVDEARRTLPHAEARFPVGMPGTGREEALRTMYQVDGSKAVEVLGIDYRPFAETVRDTLRQFLEVEKR